MDPYHPRKKAGDMEDQLILVDMNDNAIGSAGKLETHVQGRLHRAFSLFVISDGRMLIHRRADGKYHSGGLWTNAVCSHPRAGEELEDAVVRRSKQELGLMLDTCPPEVFDFIYRTDFGELSEYEYDHVFLLQTKEPPVLEPNPEEIGAVEWVALDELSQRLLTHPETFTTWFITAAPKVISLAR